MFENFISLTDIQAKLGRSRSYMWEWFRELTGCGRYPPEAVFKDGRNKYIYEPVVLDFLRNRDAIKRGELIPPYRKERKWKELTRQAITARCSEKRG